MKSTWTLTDHSRDSLINRGISAIELRDLLESPQIVQPDAQGLENIRQYVGYGITAIVDVFSKTVLTVKIDGSNKDEDADTSRPPIILPSGYSLEDILKQLSVIEKKAPRVQLTSVPRQPSYLGYVKVNPRVWNEVVKVVKERCGGDFRCITVISPTKVEIKFPR